jgi:hypothetical protein
VTEAEAHEAKKAALAAHQEAERAVGQARRDLAAAEAAELAARQLVADAEVAWRDAFASESRSSRREVSR